MGYVKGKLRGQGAIETASVSPTHLQSAKPQFRYC